MDNGVYKRLIDITELMTYLGLGKNKAMEFGVLSKSKCKIGRRVLFDRKKVDDYLDSLIENQHKD